MAGPPAGNPAAVRIGQNHAGTAAARELGRRSGAARRRKNDAVRHLVAKTRAAQGLPPTITDVEVLDRIAALIKPGVPDEAA